MASLYRVCRGRVTMPRKWRALVGGIEDGEMLLFTAGRVLMATPPIPEDQPELWEQVVADLRALIAELAVAEEESQ